MADNITQVLGELGGGAAGLVLGAWVLYPRLGEGWIGYLAVVVAVIVGAIIGHQLALSRRQ